MGDCAPSFNPLSKLNKHVNNSKSFLQNHLQSNQHQLNNNQQQLNPFQQEYSQRFSPLTPASSSQSLNRLNTSLSNVNLNTNSNSWQQEFQANRVHNGNTWQKEIQPTLIRQQSQRSMTPISTESTPILQQTNSVQSLNSMLQSSSQSRMAAMNMMMSQQLQHSSNAPQLSMSQTAETQVLKQELETKWESEFSKHEELNHELEKQQSQSIQENIIKDKYEQIWEDLTQYSDLLRRQSEYIFDQNKVNPFKQVANPYEVGMEILRQGGKLSEAIICFEAAVEQKPNFMEAWMQLGLCQTRNEMEWQGITALEKALEIQKMTPQGTINHTQKTGERAIDITVELGTCFINTGMDLMAFKLFDQWLHQNYDRWLTDYAAIEEKLNSEALLNNEEVSINKRLLTMFNHVASRNPLVTKDKSFQVILGLLNYCIDDYDMTILSFQRALELDTHDEVLWNRLGATLANHGKPEDAVHAYKQALAIKPSFVRGRYNLAISLMNIGWFKESVECLLACIKLQSTEDESHKSKEKNSSIIEALNKVFRLMNRVDLLEKLNAFKEGRTDIDSFKQEFNF
ncbi:hypothetical protein ACO0SA_004359 [Hanseniaspora valbyensis]